MPAKSREELCVIISQECIECGLCQKDCDFLRKYGNPKEIVASLASPQIAEIAFSCSLCGLCQAICPKQLDTPALMLALRQEAVADGLEKFREHGVIRRYESTGVSPRFTWYTLPEGCDTIFFPGCTLSGSRPHSTLRLFSLLSKQIPHLGVVLDCCTKPSHDLGDFPRFSNYFNEMTTYLSSAGIKQVIVACPNCYKVFKQCGKRMVTSIAWEYLQNITAESAFPPATVTIHDPCVMRSENGIQDQVRQLISRCNCNIEEMRHSRKETVCCGEGGSVSLINRELASTWGVIRKQEAENKKVITYCAGCVDQLREKKINASHLLDLYFDPQLTLNGHESVSRAPFTYWNRLRLKKYLQKNHPGSKIRKRPILEKRIHLAAYTKLALFLSLAALLITFQFTGLASFDPVSLENLAQQYPVLAPIIHLLP